MRRANIIGWAALFAIVALSKPAPVRAGLPRVLPAPPKPRPTLKPDALVPASPRKTDWVLVQTKPFFRVLATADSSARLKAEMAILAEMYDERREPQDFEWAVRRADHQFV